MKQKREIVWGMLFGGLILIGTGIWIFTAYQSGGLSGRLRLPAVIWIFYQTLGVEVGAIVQSVIGAIMVFSSFKKKS